MTKKPTNEPIDLYTYYEPTDEPSAEQEAALAYHEPEPTLENTSFYAVEPDGTEYFYCGNSRIKMSEHFQEAGKTIGNLMENVIQYAARNPPKEKACSC